jgi:hypothetical protein
MATLDIRPEAPRHEPSPVSDLALWTTVLAGPVVFLVNLQVNYTMVDWACNTGHDWALHVAHLAAVIVVAAATLLAVALWRRLGGGWPDSRGGPHARSRLLATLGALGGGLFGVSILAQWITVIVLGACPRA